MKFLYKISLFILIIAMSGFFVSEVEAVSEYCVVEKTKTPYIQYDCLDKSAIGSATCIETFSKVLDCVSKASLLTIAEKDTYDKALSASASSATKIAIKAKSLNKLQVTSVPLLIGNIIQKAMGIMGSLALVMIIYGGIMFMFAAGNAEKMKKGMNIIIWAALGIVVIFASYAIVDLVFEVFR